MAAFGGLWKPTNPQALKSPHDILTLYAMNLKPGQFSDPVIAKDHIFIMKLLAKNQARSTPFNMVQQEIEQNPVLEEDVSTEDEAHAEKTADSLPEERQMTEVPDPEKTTEVTVENISSLAEINWADYANEYESIPSVRPGGDSDLPSRLDILTKKPNLRTHLQWQLNFSNLTEKEKLVGEFVIGNLTRDGFLDVTEEDIARETGCDEERADRWL